MKQTLHMTCVGLFLLAQTFFCVAVGQGQTPEPPVRIWTDKVDPWVLEKTFRSEETEVLLWLNEQADLSGAAALKTKAEKSAFVHRSLVQTAERTQGTLLTHLRNRGLSHRSFWVANMIWVRTDPENLRELAMRPEVSHIKGNPQIKGKIPRIEHASSSGISRTDGVEWNIGKVRAPEVWAKGVTGTGAVVAGQDTGYQWDHPALKPQYRGWDGTVASHDYNWHDAIHEGTSDCGADSPVPCDDYGHGTHTMGIAVGDDGAGNQIGMAPGAQWIGCRNMREGWGSPASYSECFQWFIAPTKVDGTHADPAKAPDVINNSWSCTVSEGCTDPNILKNVVENVRAAGILTISSAGNTGSACGSITAPPAIYDASFTVGNTDTLDGINSSSSRGPVTVDGSNRKKPDVSAPGTIIRSSIPGGGYGIMTGTSMASPHVAGLAALLVSANPDLSGNVTGIENLIQKNAAPLVTSQGCGGDDADDVPNNVFGWGRIDAYAAYLAGIDPGVSEALFFPVRTKTGKSGIIFLSPDAGTGK